MALSKLIWERPELPYFRPPPLHISVLKMEDSQKIIEWYFEEQTACPATIKKNKIAIISDGHSVAKITLFEKFADKVKEGNSYLIRDHAVRGGAPPYGVVITTTTKFFRGPSLHIPPEVAMQADSLLAPPSTVTSLRDCHESKGLITIEGEIVEVSAIRKVLSGKQYVPVRTIKLTQDGKSAVVSLWRESAIVDLSLGETVILSHIKFDPKNFIQLQTTNYSKFEKKKKMETKIKILGVLEKDSAPEKLEVLLENGSIFEVGAHVFQPFEEELKQGAIELMAEIEGKTITKLNK